jgi:hypothetical protein
MNPGDKFRLFSGGSICEVLSIEDEVIRFVQPTTKNTGTVNLKLAKVIKEPKEGESV